MSGKRQHFIPRFLLEGFASHIIGDQSFIWVYRKASSPFNTNIINIGVEGNFYTLEKDTIVDDVITEAEGSFSELVDNLRKSSPGKVSDTRIPILIAHFEVRTRHFRQNILQAFDYFTAKIVDFMADEKAFIDYLKRKIQKDPTYLYASFAEELSKKGISPKKAKDIIRKSGPLISMSIEQLRPILSPMASNLRYLLPAELKRTGKTSHITALKMGISPEPKAEGYKNLEYHVVDIPEGNLFLGDSIVLFKVEGKKLFKPILTDNDALRAVLLPLSPSMVLVGTNDLGCVPLSNLRQSIARCSLEFYIANTDSDENRNLQKYIGEDADILSKADIESALDELICN